MATIYEIVLEMDLASRKDLETRCHILNLNKQLYSYMYDICVTVRVDFLFVHFLAKKWKGCLGYVPEYFVEMISITSANLLQQAMSDFLKKWRFVSLCKRLLFKQ